MNWFRQKHKAFFNQEDQALMVAAIQRAEQRTSGEVRVFVENRCRYMDALDRAKEVFFDLKMNMTALRNAVLVYVAVEDHQVAIFADTGIYERTGEIYWAETVTTMLRFFSQNRLADGITKSVLHIGEALQHHFPFDAATDKNELPDDIVFGK